MSQATGERYWSAILADFRQSGLTHVQFCERRRVSLHSFRAWLYRLRPGLPPPRSRRRANSQADLPARSSTPAFLPVQVRPRPAVTNTDHSPVRPPAVLELVLGDRCHLRIPTGFDPPTLHQLLDVLEQRS
jgi:hypothetical protein